MSGSSPTSASAWWSGTRTSPTPGTSSATASSDCAQPRLPPPRLRACSTVSWWMRWSSTPGFRSRRGLRAAGGRPAGSAGNDVLPDQRACLTAAPLHRRPRRALPGDAPRRGLWLGHRRFVPLRTRRGRAVPSSIDIAEGVRPALVVCGGRPVSRPEVRVFTIAGGVADEVWASGRWPDGRSAPHVGGRR